MVCQKCGAFNPDGNQFCMNCGEPLKAAAPAGMPGDSGAGRARGMRKDPEGLRIMREMDAKYPEYGFAGHKGYGTKAHIEAIYEHGPCPIHRASFLTKILERKPK